MSSNRLAPTSGLYEPADECTYGRGVILDGREYTLWFDDDDGRPGAVYTDDTEICELIWCRGEPLNPIAQRVMQALGFTQAKSWYNELGDAAPLLVQ